MARWTGLSGLERVAAGLALVGAMALAGGGAARAEGGPDSALRFARHGEPVATLTLADLRERVAAETVPVFEPYEQGEASFRALPFERTLDAVYSPSWRDEEELLFTCRDGYQPTVPVSRVLAHRAWLAFARTDTGAFTIRKRESGRVQQIDLAPFYLIWDNRDDEGLRQEGDYGWPYQVVGVDLIRARDRFPEMVPPAAAGPAAQAGFAAFRDQCSRCHAINGEGGSIGPELNDPAAPAGRRDPAWLHRWIDDPSQIVATARMPALNPDLPDRARTLDELVAYLQAMAEAPRRRPEARAEAAADPPAGPFQAFYDSAAQQPFALWLAAVAAGAFVWSRRGLRPGLRRYALALVVLSLLDAWLTANRVLGVGTLPAALSGPLPLFFVLAGDFRFLLLATSGTRDGAFAPTRSSLVTASALTLAVPLASQLAGVVLPLETGGSRALFLVYEILFFLLAASLPHWHPNVRKASWLRALCRFVMLYYGLWALADAILLATAADPAYALRVLPNLLYYGGLIAAIAWLAPTGESSRS